MIKIIKSLKDANLREAAILISSDSNPHIFSINSILPSPTTNIWSCKRQHTNMGFRYKNMKWNVHTSKMSNSLWAISQSFRFLRFIPQTITNHFKVDELQYLAMIFMVVAIFLDEEYYNHFPLIIILINL